MTERVVCPVHRIPDCSPLLNSCSRLTSDPTTSRRGEAWWLGTTPCPRCDNLHLLCYLLTDEQGRHQHTHYVCTFYGAGRRAPCGWHGWTVPE